MPSRSAAAKLPKAYEEDTRANVRPLPPPEHFISLENAQPSPIMLGFQKGWRRFIGFLKLSLVLAVLGAYPVAMVLSSEIDDGPVVFLSGEVWSVPGVGVAIHKIAREVAGAGIAADQEIWHPQSRLTALPAWQDATFSGLAEHVKLVAELAGTAKDPDPDLAIAARLLQMVPGEEVLPRLKPAAEALDEYDRRATRGLALRPLPEDTLPREMVLFAGWAKQDVAALTDRINAEQSTWLASKEDIEAFYAAKARAHLAHELIVAGKARAYDITGNAELAVALNRAETAWKRAADLKPVFVSNRHGSGALLPNHLSSMAYYLSEAEAATSFLAERLAPPPVVVEDVASVAEANEETAVP